MSTQGSAPPPPFEAPQGQFNGQFNAPPPDQQQPIYVQPGVPQQPMYVQPVQPGVPQQQVYAQPNPNAGQNAQLLNPTAVAQPGHQLLMSSSQQPPQPNVQQQPTVVIGQSVPQAVVAHPVQQKANVTVTVADGRKDQSCCQKCGIAVGIFTAVVVVWHIISIAVIANNASRLSSCHTECYVEDVNDLFSYYTRTDFNSPTSNIFKSPTPRTNFNSPTSNFFNRPTTDLFPPTPSYSYSYSYSNSYSSASCYNACNAEWMPGVWAGIVLCIFSIILDIAACIVCCCGCCVGCGEACK